MKKVILFLTLTVVLISENFTAFAQTSPETQSATPVTGTGICLGMDPSFLVTVTGPDFCGEKSSSCVIETCCGDGHVLSVEDPNNPGTFLHFEECEDGNDVNTDACVNCLNAACGDGFVQDGVEECDDGNTDAGDGCSPTCEIENDGTFSIQKLVSNGGAFDDANTAPGPEYAAGDTVVFQYIVTNTGDLPLNNIAVSDDQIGTITNITDQGNGDDILDVGESWTYTSANQTAIVGQYTNIGSVTGNNPDGSPVTEDADDSDPANYHTPVCGDGINSSTEECDDGNTDAGDGCSAICENEDDGMLSIQKLVNTNGGTFDDANTAPGPEFVAGDTVQFQYIVTNTGALPLNNIAVSDDQIGTITNITDQGNGDDILDVGESWTYLSANQTAVVGQYTNIGSVTGNNPDDSPVTEDADDSDPANYHTPICGDGIQNTQDEECDDGNTDAGDGCSATCELENDGMLSIQKLVKNQSTSFDDANTAPGPEYAVGDTVQFQYIVTNTGALPLNTIVVNDDQIGSISNITDQGNGDDILDVGESWTYLSSDQTAIEGQYTNIGSVTANNPDDSPVTEDADDSDPANYHTPVCGDGIVSSTEECDDGNDVDDDSCSNACTVNECGNGVVDPGEECDDGNTDNDDFCDNNCNTTCDFVRITVDGDTLNNHPDASHENRRVFDTEDFDLSSLSCLESIWGSRGNALRAGADGGTSFGSMADDGVVLRFSMWMSGEDITQDVEFFDTGTFDSFDAFTYYERLALAEQRAKEAGFASWQDAILGNLDGGGSTGVFLDLDCNPVFDNNIDGDDICGDLNVGYVVSPISLIMDEEHDINSKWELRKFKLNPYSEAEWTLWKASSAAPLLVYDPKHTGKITDGSQLCGNYTFAKRHLYSQTALERSSEYIWENGYEALAVLDLNQDGFLRGEELKDLALWFDDNRNAVSDEGEVKLLSDVGIIELAVKPDYKQPNGDIYASLGYKTSNGKQGSSVDWFTKHYNSQAAAIADIQNSQISSLQREEQILTSEASRLKEADYSGTYLWQSVDQVQGTQPLGMFVLKDFGERVIGLSIVEDRFRKNKQNIRGQLVRLPIEGKKYLKNGEVRLRFEVTAPGNIVTTSTASLSEDGAMLGVSKAIISGETEISYNWKATPAK